MSFAKLPEKQFTRPNSVTCTHTHTNTCTRIHTYILKSLIRTHTDRASTQETTRDANLPIWREFLQEGQSTERSAQRKELLSTEITGAVQPRAKRRTKMREQPNASSPNSRIFALARALSLSLARVCMCVCVHARTSAWSAENKHKHVRCLAPESWMSQTAAVWATCGHVQHESMTKAPMLPSSPSPLCTLHLSSLQSPQTSNVHNHFRRVQLQQQTIGLRTSGQTQRWAQLERVNG